MSLRQTSTPGSNRFRVRAWHVDPTVAYVSFPGPTARPDLESLRGCLDDLVAHGYTAVVTAALHNDETEPFIRCGFTEHDRLRVLCHPLETIPPEPRVDLRIRRARSADHATALEIDGRAFPQLWQLDEAGLGEALDATPRTRFRMAELAGVAAGYAVTGRSGDQGFLQRLAVEPDLHGRGIGTRLVLDALHWARRRRVRRVLVNTQTDNRTALDLYRHLGFRPTPTDLVVLRRQLQ